MKTEKSLTGITVDCPSAADLHRSQRLIVNADERSGASQEALTMSVSGVGCERTGSDEEKNNPAARRSRVRRATGTAGGG